MIGCNFCVIQVSYLDYEDKCLKGRGEKLVSTSKQYGVMVYAIADTNTNINDVNLVHELHQLKIPSTAAKVTQQVSTIYRLIFLAFLHLFAFSGHAMKCCLCLLQSVM